MDDKYMRYLIVQMFLADIGVGMYILALRYAVEDNATADKLSLAAIAIGIGILGLIAAIKILHVICNHIPLDKSMGLIFVLAASFLIGWAISPTAMQYNPILSGIYAIICSISMNVLITAVFCVAVVDILAAVLYLTTKNTQ